MKKAINIAKDYTIFLILILLGILFTIGNPAFLRFNNIITILRQSCIMGILGMGEMALIIVGGLNLSMGSCVALSTVIIAIMTVKMSLPWWLAIVVVVIVLRRNKQHTRYCRHSCHRPYNVHTLFYAVSDGIILTEQTIKYRQVYPFFTKTNDKIKVDFKIIFISSYAKRTQIKT